MYLMIAIDYLQLQVEQNSIYIFSIYKIDLSGLTEKVIYSKLSAESCFFSAKWQAAMCNTNMHLLTSCIKSITNVHKSFNQKVDPY